MSSAKGRTRRFCFEFHTLPYIPEFPVEIETGKFSCEISQHRLSWVQRWMERLSESTRRQLDEPGRQRRAHGRPDRGERKNAGRFSDALGQGTATQRIGQATARNRCERGATWSLYYFFYSDSDSSLSSLRIRSRASSGMCSEVPCNSTTSFSRSALATISI